MANAHDAPDKNDYKRKSLTNEELKKKKGEKKEEKKGADDKPKDAKKG